MKIFENVVKPILKEADTPYDVITTEYRNHGKEICKSLDTSNIKGIVTISGDGLISEVSIYQLS